MMSVLRRRMTIIFIIVIIFFVLYIFLGWGMNIMGNGNQNVREDVVGEVAGVKISTDYYRNQVIEMRNNYMKGNNVTTVSDDAQEMIEEQAFDKIVNDIVFSQIEKKYGYFTTNDEVIEVLKSVPPDYIRNDERFWENGKFNMNLYTQVISDPNNKMLVQEYYNQLSEQIPRVKLQYDVMSGIKVSKDELMRRIKLAESKFNAEIVVVPNTVEENALTVTDEEAQKYYDENKAEFYNDESAEITIVRMKKEPSTQDILLAKENIDGLRNDIISGNMDFETCAKMYSEDPGSAQNNGELGFIKKGQTVAEFDSAAFSLKKGELSPPVKTTFGWHIIRCEDKTKDSVKVSHILIRTKASYETVEGFVNRMENFRKMAAEKGLEESAQAEGFEVINTRPFKPSSGYIFELGGPAQRVCAFVMNSKKGALSNVIEEGDYLILARIDAKTDAGIKPFDEIKGIVKNKLMLKKKKLLSTGVLASAVDNIKSENMSLKRYADANGYTYKKTGLVSADENLGVAYPSRLVGAVMAAENNKVYFVTGENEGYIFKVTERQDVDAANINNIVDKYHQMLINEKQRTILADWGTYIMEKYKVKDLRY